MKKEDKLNLAFGKCFAKSNLTEAECEMLRSLSLLELVSKYGLNEVQSREIMLWCQRECQRTGSSAFVPSEEHAIEQINLNKRHYRT
jgi:hypothetical protein